ncbi:MAG: shikimate dehydrogenase [Firmicutes bacterium]|nr:shikimate dehydrogenase [Bacillota bacterium]
MESFAFILHPLSVADIGRQYPWMAKIPERIVEALFRHAPPLTVSEITGIRSPYAAAEGWLISCSLTSRQMHKLPQDYVIEKIIRAGEKAQRLGAKIVGLGAFTAVVGDGGITIARNLNIPVTTGNSYTVATAISASKMAARKMGLDIGRAEVAIIGATGAMGSTCARVLAREIRYLTLLGEGGNKLQRLASRITAETGLAVKISSNLPGTLSKADVVIIVTGAHNGIIRPQHLKPGAIICDVARPRNVSRRLARERKDLVVIEGGLVQMPPNTDFNFNFGLPPGTSCAAMAETMLLALEGRYESFSLGRDLTLAQVDEISALAAKHGFRLAGLRSPERILI